MLKSRIINREGCFEEITSSKFSKAHPYFGSARVRATCTQSLTQYLILLCKICQNSPPVQRDYCLGDNKAHSTAPFSPITFSKEEEYTGSVPLAQILVYYYYTLQHVPALVEKRRQNASVCSFPCRVKMHEEKL